MKFKFTIFLLAALLLTSCWGSKPTEAPPAPVPAAPAAPAAPAPTADRRFYYQDTEWGMTIPEVVAVKGEPDNKADNKSDPAEDEGVSVPVEQEEEADAPPQGYWDDTPNAGDEPLLIDYYYNEKTLFDKYTVTERFLFDAEQKLEGVTATVQLEQIKEDLSNLDKVKEDTKAAYLDIKETLTSLYGPVAAEYTAYMEGGEYKSKEELDMDNPTSIICTSRWDGDAIGDNYRFIYIVYYISDMKLDIRYTYHSKETVESAKANGNA